MFASTTCHQSNVTAVLFKFCLDRVDGPLHMVVTAYKVFMGLQQTNTEMSVLSEMQMRLAATYMPCTK